MQEEILQTKNLECLFDPVEDLIFDHDNQIAGVLCESGKKVSTKKVIIDYMHDIKKIIDEIIKYLEENISTTEEKFVVNSIKKCVFDEKTLNNIKPNSPPKHKSLFKGLLSISSKKIIPLKNSILKSYD